jgi:hypothetical protein
MAKHDWGYAKLCHLSECGSPEIVRCPSIPILQLVTDNVSDMIYGNAIIRQVGYDG